MYVTFMKRKLHTCRVKSNRSSFIACRVSFSPLHIPLHMTKTDALALMISYWSQCFYSAYVNERVTSLLENMLHLQFRSWSPTEYQLEYRSAMQVCGNLHETLDSTGTTTRTTFRKWMPGYLNSELTKIALLKHEYKH